MEPTFSFDRGVSRVDWPAPECFAFEFDLLRFERRGGEITGEISVRSTNTDHAGCLHQARLTLTSTRSREEVARILAKRAPVKTEVEWSLMVEEACLRTMRAFKEGRPAFLLREAQPPRAGEVGPMPPLIAGNGPTVWFGDGGAAKSYLGLAAAASLQMGAPLLGVNTSRVLRVAYCDWEWDSWPHKERLRSLLGLQDDRALPELLYVPCQAEGPLPAQVERLRKLFHQHQVEFAVLDSVGYACEGAPEEAEAALAFFRALARLEVGSLLLAHMNRQGDTDRPFGSVFWHNSARCVWFVKKQAESHGSLTVGMFNRKANAGPLSKPIGLNLAFEENRTLIDRIDIHEVPELAVEIPLRARIGKQLLTGPMTMFELAEGLSVKVDSIRKTLERNEGKSFTRVSTSDGVQRWAALTRQEAIV